MPTRDISNKPSRSDSRNPSNGAAPLPAKARVARRQSPRSVSPIPPACASLAENTPDRLRGGGRLAYQLDQLKRLKAKDRISMHVHMDQLISKMIRSDASDIDMGGESANGSVWYRIHGDKSPDRGAGGYTVDETNFLILNLLDEVNVTRILERGATDFSYQVAVRGQRRSVRLRATVYFDMEYLALNMRAITDQLRTLKSINLHPSVERGMMFQYVRDGLTLITGVTGSGKSTTLDAIIDANNEELHGHIVIIGNPIEYRHDSKKCIIRHREVGRDVPNFKDGIVQSLRQDPDIIVIGEMRDPETISAALEITDSGHKVFSTLHTSSAVESIDRIIAEYPHEEQTRVRNRLADVLRCIISQKLVPSTSGGRVLAKEVLWMTPPARAAIKNGNINEVYQMVWEGTAHGQCTLEQDLFRLLREGQITRETALNFGNNKRRLNQLIQ
ncbi:MAG: Flp pilus assembly complex ATPase component TadA [Bacteroidetes bacterium]|nr:Flp pilus assembly complex ATPase component TadA [Bacteroidota bacterium]